MAIALLSTETGDGEVTESIRNTLLELQRLDPFVKDKVYELIPKPNRPGSERHWILDQEGLLRFKGAVYVPNEKSIQSELIHIHHDGVTAGHFGVRRTLEVIQRKYFWQSLRKDVKSYVKTCPECQRGKAKTHRTHGELAPIPIPGKPWEEITMDFITDLPPSKLNGQIYDSILVIVDRYTKMGRFIPVRKTIDAAELAEVFIHHVYKDFGCPKGITSDRGSVFTSKFWGTLMWYLQIRRRLSTAYRPQTDGQTERMNQIVEFYLRTYCNYRQDDWTTKLALAEFSYNNSIHATTESTPFRLLYGFDPELGINVGDAVMEGGAPRAEERIQLLNREREELSTRLRTAQDSHKKFYDKKHKATRFKVGDKVILSAKNIRQLRPSRKLSNKFLGPFEVV
jgi:transposase InsO family protein